MQTLIFVILGIFACIGVIVTGLIIASLMNDEEYHNPEFPNEINWNDEIEVED